MLHHRALMIASREENGTILDDEHTTRESYIYMHTKILIRN